MLIIVNKVRDFNIIQTYASKKKNLTSISY